MTSNDSPPAHFTWRDEPSAEIGVTERGFVIDAEGEHIPGVLWSPRPLEETTAPLPLVLMGHGGQSHKRADRMAAIGRRLARRQGFLAASIDQIDHGERGPLTDEGGDDTRYRALWQRPGIIEQSVAQWRAVTRTLAALTCVDDTRIGFWGLSMGTMFGMPFVAEEPLVRAAVLGLAALTGPSVDRSGIRAMFEVSAPRVACPVMWVIQWDDERFDRDGSIALYNLLGTAVGNGNKRLIAFPGLHAEAPDESTVLTREFLGRELGR